MSVHLRPTTEDDLDYVLAAEGAAENRDFVGQWDADGHLAVIRDPTKRHLVVERQGKPVGYMIIEDLDDPGNALQLRRLVITRKRQGYGLEALRAAARLAFGKLGAERLWLDVYQNNAAAIALYRKAGYRVEQQVHGCVKGGGKDVMLIMSLHRESG